MRKPYHSEGQELFKKEFYGKHHTKTTKMMEVHEGRLTGEEKGDLPC